MPDNNKIRCPRCGHTLKPDFQPLMELWDCDDCGSVFTTQELKEEYGTIEACSCPECQWDAEKPHDADCPCPECQQFRIDPAQARADKSTKSSNFL